MKVRGADRGNAYLEAVTKGKLYIVAGPEFEELEEHILIIYKALMVYRVLDSDEHEESMT